MRMDQLPTPCYVIDEKKLKENLEILGDVREKAGCKILLAQKAFSCFYEYPLIGQYLDGTTASGLYEARLGKEEMGKENHVFAPAYKDADIKDRLHAARSWFFLGNFRQRFRGRVSAACKSGHGERAEAEQDSQQSGSKTVVTIRFHRQHPPVCGTG